MGTDPIFRVNGVCPHFVCPHFVVVLLMWLASVTWARGEAAVEVFTHQYDNARTGANLAERQLHHRSVTREGFGRLYRHRLDGAVLAQPLIAAGVELAEHGRQDVLIAVTSSNSVYALDAAGDASKTFWRRALTTLPGGRAAQPGGILGTPVIDRARGALFVVAPLVDGDKGRFVLHALDLRDGGDLPGSPVLIEGAVTLEGQTIAFDPTTRRLGVQRAALALANERVVIAFGGDFFEGWVFSYARADLRAPPAVFCTTCASRLQSLSGIDYLDARCTLVGPGGGIWQSGRGPAVDAQGVLHFFVGNKQHVVRDGCAMRFSDNACSGCRDPRGCICKGNRASAACRGHDACEAHQSAGGAFDTHDALIALSPTLDLLGWYRPDNWDAAGVHGLEYNDLDLGGSGPTLLPDGRLIGGGKQGVMYLLDVTRADSACVPSLARSCLAANPTQSFMVAPVPPRPNEYARHLLGGAVLWTRPATQGGSRVYLWRVNDSLRAYRLDGGFQDCDGGAPAPTALHDCRAEALSAEFIDHHPGGVLTLSAAGTRADSAIVWASRNQSTGNPASLMAFKALPGADKPGVLEKIWSSEWCEGDALDAGSEFVPPVVANGRVYLATSGGSVEVFGLLSSRPCVAQPERIDFGPMMR